MRTARLVLTRLAGIVFAILVIATINFTLVHSAPGDPASVMAGQSGATDEKFLEELRAEYGLDKPFMVQLGTYLKKVVTLDLGYSYRQRRPVNELILDRLGPTLLLTLSAFFREIPWEMEQAAQVDGATSWQAFRKVIVPLAAPGVFTAAILTFFFAWNDFVFGISLTSTERARPIPAALSFFVGADPFNRPASLLAAAAVVATVPVILLVLFFQRKIVAGLTAGAVKG